MKYLSLKLVNKLHYLYTGLILSSSLLLLMVLWTNFFSIVLSIFGLLVGMTLIWGGESSFKYNNVEYNCDKFVTDRYRMSFSAVCLSIFLALMSLSIHLAFDNLFFEVIAYVSIPIGFLFALKIFPGNLTQDQKNIFNLVSSLIKENNYKLTGFDANKFQVETTIFSNEEFCIKISGKQMTSTEQKSNEIKDISKLLDWNLKFQIFRQLALNEVLNFSIKQKFVKEQITESIKSGNFHLNEWNRKRKKNDGTFNGPQLTVKIRDGEMFLIDKQAVEVNSSMLYDSYLNNKVFEMISQKEERGSIIDSDVESVDHVLAKALSKKLSGERS